MLLDGLAALITDGHLVGAPILKHAIDAFRGTDLSVGEGIRWLWLACHAAGLVWDYESWDVLSARQATCSRDAGSLIGLVIAYSTRAGLHLFAGDFATAAALVVEVQSVMQETASNIAPYGAVTLAVLRGREAQAFELIEVATKDVEARGEGEGLTFALWAKAVLCNSLGRYSEALAAARQASEDSHVQWFSTWASAELIEAAARSRIPEAANGALQRLSERTRASATDWALGVRLVPERCLATVMLPKAFTGEVSIYSLVLRCASSWGVLFWSTASGCAANAVAVTAASSSAVHTRSSTQ